MRNYILWPLICAGSTVLLGLILVANWGFVWHFLYGDSILHKGRNIPVPKGFYVLNDSDSRYDSRTLWKTDFGTPFWDAPYGQITIFELPHRFVFEEDYPGYKAGILMDAKERGFTLRETDIHSSEKDTYYCLEGTDEKSTSSVLARCAIRNSNIIFFYQGHTKYLPAFYSTVQRTTLEPKNNDE